jgi:hypothetical protein
MLVTQTAGKKIDSSINRQVEQVVSEIAFTKYRY